MIDPSRVGATEPVQKGRSEPDLRVVGPAPALTIVASEAAPETDWVLEVNRRRGESLLGRLEDALRRGRSRHADRLRAEFLGVVHQDRIASACLAARDAGLRFEPVGHGDLVDVPTLYQLRRTPWHVRPLGPPHDPGLPEGARHAKAIWDGHADAFDALYEAVEAPEPARAPSDPRGTRAYLVGVISADGVTGDWFVLDDWDG